MRKVFPAGATGRLGRHVMRELGMRGYFVRALVRTAPQASDLRGFVQEIVTGDLTVPQTLTGCCAGIDTVISTAGASVDINTRGKTSFRDIDFAGNRNLLYQAVNAKVRKFIYISAFCAGDLARTEYVRAKEDFAALVIQSGLDYQILRPTGFFSAFSFLPGMARRHPLPLVGPGESRTNPIDDEEVATAGVEAIDSQAPEIALGGPDVLTRQEILDLAFAAAGQKPRYQRVPAFAVILGGAAAGLFRPRMRHLAEFYLAVSRHDAVAPVYGKRRLADYFSQLARHA